MSQQGNLFSISIHPQAVVDALREAGLAIEITGAEDEWRQITIRPRIDDGGDHRLVLALKTRDTDQLYFRRQLPAMINVISQIPAEDVPRRDALQQLAERFGACITLTADPGFSEHGEFIEAMTLVARLIDGIFVIQSGFLDAESREVLMIDGTSSADAVLPALPEFPTAVRDTLHDDQEQDVLPFDVPFNPPPPRRVAERMYVLLTIAYRGALETHPERPERTEKLHRLAEWFWSLNIGHEMEESERHFLDQPLGGIAQEEAHRLAVQFESVMVLGWALGLLPLLNHDQFVQPALVAEALGLFGEDTHFVIDSAELREHAELCGVGDRIMAVHWRLREFELNPVAIDFAGMARSAWFGQIDLRNLPMIDGDLALSGAPVASADPAVRRRCQLGIESRHRALNWACGHHRIFSQVDVST
ncbi:MAG: DUF4272 domain-containing protein [Burkholderiales bacterium]|nr:DUF4272 domain-containing protein [Phycisphaerae bacterium]